MSASHAIALIGLLALLACWLGVQLAWRRSFPDATQDGDALAQRIGCGTCERTDACAQRGLEEERR